MMLCVSWTTEKAAKFVRHFWTPKGPYGIILVTHSLTQSFSGCTYMYITNRGTNKFKTESLCHYSPRVLCTAFSRHWNSPGDINTIWILILAPFRIEDMAAYIPIFQKDFSLYHQQTQLTQWERSSNVLHELFHNRHYAYRYWDEKNKIILWGLSQTAWKELTMVKRSLCLLIKRCQHWEAICT